MSSVAKLNVYVLHVKGFVNRKSLSEKLRLEFENASDIDLASFAYIETHDPGEPLDGVSIDMSPIPSDDARGLHRLNSFLRPLKIAHVSNAMKHMRALKMISESSDTSGHHLVLEDDSIRQTGNNSNMLDAIQKFTSNKGSIMFLGVPPGVGANGMQFVKDVYNALPCCDSYLVDKDTASKILNAFLPIKFPCNINMTYAMAKAGIEPVICSPSVFVDGSKLGVFLSTIDSNNRLVFNGTFVALSKAVSDEKLLGEGEMSALFKTAEPKWHPEYMHLRAVYEHKKGNHSAAKEHFDEALSQYSSLGGIYDNQNELLRNAMRLYRFLQT